MAAARPLADTAAVAVFIHRTPAQVRLLVSRGQLQPVACKVTLGHALLFDLRDVVAAVGDTPGILGVTRTA